MHIKKIHVRNVILTAALLTVILHLFLFNWHIFRNFLSSSSCHISKPAYCDDPDSWFGIFPLLRREEIITIPQGILIPVVFFYDEVVV